MPQVHRRRSTSGHAWLEIPTLHTLLQHSRGGERACECTCRSLASCVQFARSADGGYEQYAIKFFLQLEDYRREQALYQDEAIKRTLPELLQASDNAAGAFVSRSGFRFPAHLVMARGTPLREYASSQSSACVREHSAMLAHRERKNAKETRYM